MNLCLVLILVFTKERNLQTLQKMHTFSLLFSNKNLILYTLHPIHPFGRKAQIMILVVEPVTLIAMKKILLSSNFIGQRLHL